MHLFAQAAFGLCGVTHTIVPTMLAKEEAMQLFGVVVVVMAFGLTVSTQAGLYACVCE